MVSSKQESFQAQGTGQLGWVTLLTCEGYNPRSGDYLSRRIVRAVLMEVR